MLWTELHKWDVLFILTWPAFLNARSGSGDTSWHLKVHSVNVLQSFHFAISRQLDLNLRIDLGDTVGLGGLIRTPISTFAAGLCGFYVISVYNLTHAACGSYRLHMFLVDYEWATHDTVNSLPIHSSFITARLRRDNPTLAGLKLCISAGCVRFWWKLTGLFGELWLFLRHKHEKTAHGLVFGRANIVWYCMYQSNVKWLNN